MRRKQVLFANKKLSENSLLIENLSFNVRNHPFPRVYTTGLTDFLVQKFTRKLCGTSGYFRGGTRVQAFHQQVNID
jgi:hypothetical protein